MTSSGTRHRSRVTSVAGQSPRELVPVRRRDVRFLARNPVDSPLRTPHGDEYDVRYRPRELRTRVGFVLDLAVHTSAGLALVVALVHAAVSMPLGARLGAALGGYIATSLTHRVLVQWLVRTTAGKATAGLVLIRSTDGARPTLWDLCRAWLLGAAAVAVVLVPNP